MIHVLIASAVAATIPTGVTPDDGNDDGAGFRAALATACGTGGDHLLEVPVGTFEISRESGKLGGLNVSGCAGLSIIGKGRAASRLRMVPTTASGDYYLINIDSGSTDVEVSGLSLDGRRAAFEALGATETQVHLIRTNVVYRVDVHDADLIDALGAGIKTISTDDVSIVNVRFRGHGRGGFEGHSYVTDARLVANSFDDIRSQHISQEGGGGDARWTIVANNHGPHGSSTDLLYDLGSGATDVAVIGNTMIDGGVQGYNLSRFSLVGNTINQTASSGPSGFYLKGKNEHGSLVGNAVTSAGTSAAETSCFRLSYINSSSEANTLSLVANSCQHAGGAGIYSTTATGRLALGSNVIASTGTSGFGVYIRGYGTVRGLAATGNVIMNEAQGVALGANSGTFDDGAFSGNVIQSTKTSAYGFNYEVWNHAGVPYATKCRVDSNVLDVTGTKIRNAGTVSPQPTSSEGCILHGDAVP